MHHASPLVTRPPCSWTSTCCRVVQPAAAVLGGDVRRGQAELPRPGLLPLGDLGGSSPPASSASTSKGMSSSANVRAAACTSRSASVRRCMRAPGDGLLTDCSVYASVPQVTTRDPATRGSADAVVVGGGTVGGWCAWFLRQSGLERVVLLEADTLGKGASSRAAGMVRAQGGTETAVRLGQWTQDFYRGQRDSLPLDSGFVEQGYCMPCFTAAEIEQAQVRIAMQQRARPRRPVARAGRVRRAEPRDGARADPRLVVRAGRRLHRPAAQRPRLHGGPGHRGRRHPRGRRLHRPAHPGRPGRGGHHQRRRDRHRPGGAHRRPAARRGRAAGRCAGAGRRHAAPGRRHRAAPRPRRGPAADGVRRAGRHLLAARGGRPALGDEQPRRSRPASRGSSTTTTSP